MDIREELLLKFAFLALKEVVPRALKQIDRYIARARAAGDQAKEKVAVVRKQEAGNALHKWIVAAAEASDETDAVRAGVYPGGLVQGETLRGDQSLWGYLGKRKLALVDAGGDCFRVVSQEGLEMALANQVERWFSRRMIPAAIGVLVGIGVFCTLASWLGR